MKSFLKGFLYATLNAVSLFLPRARAAILLYHDVGESDLYLTVRPSQFASQMRHLKKRGYRVVSLRELAAALAERKSIPKRTVALTFDDVYPSHLSAVLPTLEKYGFRGTFFAATDFLGGVLDNSEHKPQRILDAEGLKRLDASPCADVEPHSLSHREFPALSEDDIHAEINGSRACLERLLGKTCAIFAYPRGAYDDASRNIARDSGFIAAVGVEEGMVGPRSDLFALPRNTVNSRTGLMEFRGKLTHSSGLLARMRNLL